MPLAEPEELQPSLLHTTDRATDSRLTSPAKRALRRAFTKGAQSARSTPKRAKREQNYRFNAHNVQILGTKIHLV